MLPRGGSDIVADGQGRRAVEGQPAAEQGAAGRPSNVPTASVLPPVARDQSQRTGPARARIDGPQPGRQASAHATADGVWQEIPTAPVFPVGPAPQGGRAYKRSKGIRSSVREKRVRRPAPLGKPGRQEQQEDLRIGDRRERHASTADLPATPGGPPHGGRPGGVPPLPVGPRQSTRGIRRAGRNRLRQVGQAVRRTGGLQPDPVLPPDGTQAARTLGPARTPADRQTRCPGPTRPTSPSTTIREGCW